MFVRVHELRQARRYAIGAATALGLSVLYVTQQLRPHIVGSTLGYALFASMLVAWTAAPLLLRWERPATAQLEVRAAGIVLAGAHVVADDVAGISIVPAARGASVALSTTDGRTRFVEVASVVDGRRLAAALGVYSVPQGTLFFRIARSLRAVELLLLGFAGVCGVLYWVSAAHIAQIVSGGKAFFGIPLLVVALLQSALLLVRPLFDRDIARRSDEPAASEAQLDALPEGALFDHVRLHLGPRAPLDDAAEGRDARLAPAVDETSAAWLRRLDALRMDAGYREGATTADELWSTLADPEADALERAAAARLLRKWEIAPREEILARVADPEVRARVDVTMAGDEDEVEERLERMGPVFRARS